MTTQGRVPVAVGAAGVGEEARDLSVGADGRADQGGEEGEVVHGHHRLAVDQGLVGLVEEGVGEAGDLAAIVELPVYLEPLDRLVRVGVAQDLEGLRVLPSRAVGEEGVLDAHGDGVVVLLGVDGYAVETIVRAGEELGDVEKLIIGLRHGQVVAVLCLEGRHLVGVLEQVLAVGPAVGITLGGEGPVVAGGGRVFAVVGQGGLSHRVG